MEEAAGQKTGYTPDEVYELIERDAVVLCDVRVPESYHKGHIPGAVNIPEVFNYLAESTPEGIRHMYEKLHDIFSESGIHDDSLVIFYEDDLAAQFGVSSRGYLFLKILGHSHAGILRGGFAAWTERGLPVEIESAPAETSSITTDYQLDYIASKEDVLSAIDDSDVILLDNRDRVEWIGESSSPYGIDYAPRKGRLPGARWIEWYEFMKRPGAFSTFKSSGEIRSLCATQGIYPGDDIIIYCFKGARASNTYMALQQAGFTRLRIYFGSWNEWSRYPSLPIEEGPPKSG